MNSPQAVKKKKVCLSGCRYDVVCRVALECGFKIVPEHDMWNLNWSDAPLAPEKVMEMRRTQNANAMSGGGLPPLMQKMNHFPGMYEICRKDRLGRNLNRLKRVFSDEYDFFPSTWDLPSDMSDLMAYWRRNKNATFIVKPESGCQGKGIFLVRNLKLLCPFVKCVCQLYVTQPFLISGYKYDQRIYVLITCVDPLRVYIYNEGIARFATVKYSMPSDQNLDVVFMHLTNYSLNKFSESYDPQGEGSKRKLSAVYSWMTEHGHDVQKLIDSIDDIIVKTIICAAPTLRHNYRTSFPKREYGCNCFELLGFDILVDRHLRPMLVEVNHSPSFNLDLPVDSDVKTDLLRDVFAMVYMGENKSGSTHSIRTTRTLKSQKRLSTPVANNVPQIVIDQFAHEEKYQGNFRLIFSEQSPGKYARFLDKEYSITSTEEESFLKKRLEPIISDISRNDQWPGEPQTRTSLKQTRNGQVYVETRPRTPGVLDPQEFMKFKCNVENSPYYNKCSVPLKSAKNKRSSKTRKPAFGESLAIAYDGPIERNSGIDSGSAHGDKCLTNKELNVHPVLTASQRVKIALEKLRQKNVDKFKFTARLNDGVLRSATASTITEKTSPYLVDALRLSKKKSMKKLKKGRDSNSSVTRPAGKVLDLDASKLPSVCNPFLKNQFEEAQFENQGTPEESKELIENWISKGQFKLTKSNTMKTDVNNNKQARDNEVNRLKLSLEQQSALIGLINAQVSDKSKKKLSKSSPKQVSTFDPISIDDEEERCRRRGLTARKKVIDSLGIQETVLKVMKMTGTSDKRNESVHPKPIQRAMGSL